MSSQWDEGQPVDSAVPHRVVVPRARSRPKRRRCTDWRPTDVAQLEATEAEMLSFIKTSHTTQRMVACINTLSSIPADTATPSGESPSADAGARHIVMLHGFAGGIGLWMPNLDALIDAARCAATPTTLHVIDMPGFGRSVRESVLLEDHVDAMNYMTDKIHEWLLAMGIVSPQGTLPDGVELDLVGHSFGAYVSAVFTSRRPELITRLVLCDPWGVPPPDTKLLKGLPFRFKLALKLFYWGNPFSILRGVGPWGPNLIKRARPDFADRWEPIVGDPNIFFDYVYHCNAASPPTGEQIFQACCTGPVGPQHPMQDFLPALPGHVHISALYGADTWMDREAGRAMIEKARETRAPRVRCTIQMVPNAGHQINTDNISDFNDALLAELQLSAAA